MSPRRFVVEADGGSRGNPGPAGYGALVRDADTGAVLVERADSIGIATNNVAEYEGLIAGLEEARALDPEAVVEVRMDSKLVVEQMSGRWGIKHESMRRLALRARDLLPTAGITFTWVPRERNRAADALANRALDAVAAGRSPAILLRHNDSEPDDLPGASAADPLVAASGLVRGPDLADPTTLVLVRHGVTEFTEQRRFSGSGGADLPLTELGRRQAQAVASEIAARGGADALVCSPLLRTRQTAQAIAAELGLGEPELLDGLRECAFGDWDGMTFSEVRATWPRVFDAWLASVDIAPPGGESVLDVDARVAAAESALVRRHTGRRVVVVSHTSPIKSVALRALGADLAAAHRVEVAPCSLTSVAHWEDGVRSLRGLGERGHLRGLEALVPPVA